MKGFINGDVYLVRCPECGESEAVLPAPFAEKLKCRRCGRWVTKERIVRFVCAPLFDEEEVNQEVRNQMVYAER